MESLQSLIPSYPTPCLQVTIPQVLAEDGH